MTIGEQIRYVRKQVGLTQKELGTLSGTSETTIKQYELGKRQPRIEKLQKIAHALGGTISDIFIVDDVDKAMELREDELRLGLDGMKFGIVTQKIHDFLAEDEYRLLRTYYKLNDEGKAEAIKRVDELTEIRRYQSECNLEIPENVEKMKQQRIEAESKPED